MDTDLYELEGGDGGQSLHVRVVERAGRVRGVSTRDPVDQPLRLSRPVGCGECEAIVRPSVHRVHLQQYITETSPTETWHP